MKDRIIYEDNELIIVNKPANMPTQASEKKKQEDLYTSLQTYLNQRDGQEVYLALHHRLDAATSGLILFSKSKSVNKAITDMFREKSICKKYQCLVDLNEPLQAEQWEVKNKIIEYRYKHFKKAKSSPNGKTAHTKFKLLEQMPQCARLECEPLTGRLHQIRVHLAEMGLPVQGDFHYNKHYKQNEFKLCAFYLAFKHPLTKKQIEVSIPIPF